MLKKIFCILTVLAFLSGCSSDQHKERQAHFERWIEANGKLKVLSTTAIIDDIVSQVGGDHVNTITLIQGELDPHSYQLVKGDDEKLNFAQLIFCHGLELEHGPSLHHYLANNSKSCSLGDQIDRRHPGLILDIDGQKDPHIWMDISLWGKTVPIIVETLSKQDPEHAAIYEKNGALLAKELDKAHDQVKEIMLEVPSEKRFLVTSHDAFHYFARAYLAEEGEHQTGEWKKRFAAPEGLAPESQLSVGDIQSIIDHLQRHQISLVFPESNVSRDSIRKIVQAGGDKGLELSIACCPLYGDAMGPQGSEADTYTKMILYNARTLASHMNPRSGDGGK